LKPPTGRITAKALKVLPLILFSADIPSCNDPEGSHEMSIDIETGKRESSQEISL
jgi:hypothetical protein